MASKCDCDDWAPQIDILNGPISLQTIRSGGTYRYSGKPFRYCPWCGAFLHDNPPLDLTAEHSGG